MTINIYLIMIVIICDLYSTILNITHVLYYEQGIDLL